MALFFHSLTLALALTLAFAFAVARLHAAAKGFAVELIHRDSPRSPLYNPNATGLNLWRAAVDRSHQRAHQFLTPNSSGRSIVSRVVPNAGSYLMQLSLGTPPIIIHAIADTGSDLTWTNCVPCTLCYQQKPPLFNPVNSSSYSELSCSSHFCTTQPELACNEYNNKCEYKYSYADGSAVTGLMSTERFTFSSATGGDVSIEATVFGCSHVSLGTFDINEGGLVGLGGGELSLVSQLGDSIANQFSYCLQPREEVNKSSRLIFGPNVDHTPKGEILETPFLKDDVMGGTFYILRLVNITVGNKFINILPGSDDKIIIDSGTELTILHKKLLEEVVAEVKKGVDLPLVTNPEYQEFSACFKVDDSTQKKLLDFLTISFEFDGAKVPLKPENVLIRVDHNVTCLALASSEDDSSNLQVYGNIAQQGFYIAYDLRKRRLSIAPANCTEI